MCEWPLVTAYGLKSGRARDRHGPQGPKSAAQPSSFRRLWLYIAHITYINVNNFSIDCVASLSTMFQVRKLMLRCWLRPPVNQRTFLLPFSNTAQLCHKTSKVHCSVHWHIW